MFTLEVDLGDEDLKAFHDFIDADEKDRIQVKYREWKMAQYLESAKVEVPTEKFIDPIAVVEETNNEK